MVFTRERCTVCDLIHDSNTPTQIFSTEDDRRSNSRFVPLHFIPVFTGTSVTVYYVTRILSRYAIPDGFYITNPSVEVPL